MSELPYRYPPPMLPPDFEPRHWQQEGFASFREAHARHSGTDPFVFSVEAGVGSGKTKFSAMIALFLLNSKQIDSVVYVCPNQLIRTAVIKVFASFGINLYSSAGKKKGDRPDFGAALQYQGEILTYQGLVSNPPAYKSTGRRLVVFDEFHHLGDSLAWGEAARTVFVAPGNIILPISGTPFRTDDNPIPFLVLDRVVNGVRHYRCAYRYPMACSILDDNCRRPVFIPWLDAHFDTSLGQQSFADGLPSERASQLLAAAVAHGAESRTHALLRFRELVQAGQRGIIFLGGDSYSDGSAVYDAEHLLPDELVHLGFHRDDIVPVTSASRNSRHRIDHFNAGHGRIVTCVNMVGEGVDIPSLEVALFLTQITALNTTIQRIGRVMRGSGSAGTLMFRHPDYVRLAAQIDRDIDHAIRVRMIRDPGANREGSSGPRSRPSIKAIDGFTNGGTFNGRLYTEEQICAARNDLLGRGLSANKDTIGVSLEYLFPLTKGAVA